ncbi:hypothetical protein [Curtobacterium sp. MCPF17_052]|uniref:hypothetical protein n=1 Tax=Curtobacterium sp. MCPF17_052 TaxID=2175655 RepID=UPI0011B82FC8|nr:hypothetical protein [Curtobacterium sp. MCPF17_052]WIB12469.1 hypothetical protein DEJ36_17805 [Curtobacterium sp. MCPF17_052]
MDRTTKLKNQTIGVPKFVVRRSAGGQLIPANDWRLLTSGAFGTPIKNVGFTWSGGVLTVPRAGIYDIRAHVMFRSNDYGTVGVQVTRNTTVADGSGTVLANEISPMAPAVGTSLHMGVSDAEFVSLNANDQLRVHVLQRNRSGDTVNIGSNDRPFDLTFACVWVDSL